MATEIQGKIPVRIYPDHRSAELAAAEEVATLVRVRRDEGLTTVLGLATGKTMEGVYARLVAMNVSGELDFTSVHTFTLDEYLGMRPGAIESFDRWIRLRLLDRVNLPPQNIHMPRGDLPEDDWQEHCREYEEAIEAAGGVDLQLLGVGVNGHIAFNEPGSPRDSRTRVVQLAPTTREVNSVEFRPGEIIPTHAISVGIGTILEARRVRVLAFGNRKAKAVKEGVRGEPTADVPLSLLQGHDDARLLVDREAGAGLQAGPPAPPAV